MNRFTQFIISGVLAAWISGCSESKTHASSINSIDEIKMQVLTAINRALDNRKDPTNQSIPVKNDSDTCSIEVPDNFQENKTIHIECYGSDTSVTAILPRNGFWMIKGIAFHWWKLETQSGCIVWNIRLKNGEIQKKSTCDNKMSA